jgi:hypothetical protein
MSMRSILLVVLAAIVAVSCSRLPRTDKPPEEMASIRAEYLQNHPDGQYTDHIMEGRVVKGMNTLEVLASWGLPNVRRNWSQDNSEYWTYYAQDEHTEQVVSYDLIFEEKVLARWVVGTERGKSLGSVPGDPSVGTVQEILRLGADTRSDETAGKKK